MHLKFKQNYNDRLKCNERSLKFQHGVYIFFTIASLMLILRLNKYGLTIYLANLNRLIDLGKENKVPCLST